jgi:hypothetical protein
MSCSQVPVNSPRTKLNDIPRRTAPNTRAIPRLSQRHPLISLLGLYLTSLFLSAARSPSVVNHEGESID